MKKIIALILVFIMMLSSCASQEPIEETVLEPSTAEGASEGDFNNDEEEKNSSEASESHSSQTSEDSAETSSADREGNYLGENSEEKAAYSQSSAPENSSSGNPGSLLISAVEKNKNESAKGGDSIQGSYVKRADSKRNGGSYFLKNNAAGTGDTVIVFTDRASLAAFAEELCEYYQADRGENSLKAMLLSYGDEFFKENNLVLAHIESGSGSVRYDVTGISISGDNFTMNVKATMPEVGTTDMADFFIVVELEKEAKIENAKNFTIKLGF